MDKNAAQDMEAAKEEEKIKFTQDRSEEEQRKKLTQTDGKHSE